MTLFAASAGSHSYVAVQVGETACAEASAAQQATAAVAAERDQVRHHLLLPLLSKPEPMAPFCSCSLSRLHELAAGVFSAQVLLQLAERCQAEAARAASARQQAQSLSVRLDELQARCAALLSILK